MILFKRLTDTPLPFKYSLLKNDIYQAECGQWGIETADQNGEIEVIEWEAHEGRQFVGGHEPIYDNGYKFVHPSDDGQELVVELFGNWQCKRCGHIFNIPLNGTLIEPFECQNDTCGRKSCFSAQFQKELIKVIWKLPNKPIKANAWEVYNDVYLYIKDHLILKDDEYFILALWIVASWIQDEFDTACYSLFVAPKSSGKTQALNVINELGYRAFLTVSITPAAIFRSLDMWRILPLIDESEFQINTNMISESASALYGLMNGGYKRGNKALRTDDNTRIPTAYDIFGFKACASTKIFLPTLESRSIIYHMAQGKPKNILIDEERAKIIRSKLLYFRFSTLGKVKTVIPESPSGRLIELFIPLFSTLELLRSPEDVNCIGYRQLKPILEEKMREMDSDRKQEEKSSPEAQVIQAVCGFITLGVDAVTAKSIAQEVKWAEETDTKEFRKTTQRIGYILKELGIKTKQTMIGNMIDFTDERTIIRIDELKQRYFNVAK